LYFVPNKSKLANFAQQFGKLMHILWAKAALKHDFVAIDYHVREINSQNIFCKLPHNTPYADRQREHSFKMSGSNFKK